MLNFRAGAATTFSRSICLPSISGTQPYFQAFFFRMCSLENVVEKRSVARSAAVFNAACVNTRRSFLPDRVSEIAFATDSTWPSPSRARFSHKPPAMRRRVPKSICPAAPMLLRRTFKPSYRTAFFRCNVC